MIRSFLNDPNEKKDVPLDEEKVDANIQAINEAMSAAKFKKKDLAAMKIDDGDVKKMKELVKVLDPLEEGITLLGGEKYCTGSVVLPYIKNFKKVLQPNENDPTFLNRFKRDLEDELNTRCSENLNNLLLAKASFFDKRVANLSFLDATEKAVVLKEIEDELKVVEKKIAEEKKVNEENGDDGPKKKKRFLGNNLLDDSNDENIAGVMGELNRYQTEKKLKSDGDPLSWWRSHRAEYPVMARLARKYLTVQGTSTPAEHVISRLGIVLSKSRQAMSGPIFSKIIFLTDVV